MDFEYSVRRVLDALPDHIPDHHDPDWEPLERALPIEHCAGFMWMGRDGDGINAYKQGITRRYLHLSLDRENRVCAHRYVGDGYAETSLQEAIDEAFEGIEKAPGVNPDDPAPRRTTTSFVRARIAPWPRRVTR